MLEYKQWAEMGYCKKWKVTQLRTSKKNLAYELGAYKLEMTEKKERLCQSVTEYLCVPACFSCKKPVPRAYQGRYIQHR